MEPNRPPLRVVAPDERAPEPPPPDPAIRIAPTAPIEPTKAFIDLQEQVGRADAAVPLCAAYLVCDGCYLADAALSFYHSAAAHSPAGTFRHDVPPGLKSAEATRTWLGTHLAAVKLMADDESVRSYSRARDLKEAVALAATELQRAHATAQSVGLKFDDRYAALLTDADGDLEFVSKYRAPVSLVQVDPDDDAYIVGAFVLGMGPC